MEPIKRIGSDREITTLDTSITDTYKRFSREIKEAQEQGNIQRADELMNDLLDFMVSVGDAK
jgi:hypothetical protein